MYSKKIKFLIVFILVVFISFNCTKRSESLDQSHVEPLMNIFLSSHVSQNKFNDEISRRTLSNIIQNIDPWKRYFYQSDIDRINKFKVKIDDFVKSGKYEFLFTIFDIYKTRYKERMKDFSKLLESPVDFQIDEKMLIDNDKVKFVKNDKEMHERWRKFIKFQLVNYINSGVSLKSAKDKIKKKFKIIDNEVKETDKDKMYSILLNSFATALDPHTNYMTAEEYEDLKISMDLKLEGIGAVLRSEDGFVFVEKIIPGGPSSRLPENKNIRPDDKIIAVAQGNKEPESLIDVSLRNAVKKIRGKKGTLVRLTLVRKDKEKNKMTQLEIPIIRDEIILEDQAAKSDVYLHKGERKTKIGYIRLPSFYLDHEAFLRRDPNAKISSRDMLKEVLKLKQQNIEGLVIDLRGNPGGSLGAAINIVGLFIESGPVVQRKESNNILIENDKDPRIFYDGPIIVLVNKLSASASEIFSGAIKDYKRGIIIGSSPTFGKGSVQTIEELPTGMGAIKVTKSLFYLPKGYSNNIDGIKPDLQIPSLTQLLNIGEGKTRYPLKWTPIKSAKFKSYGNKYISKSIVSRLNSKKNQRIKKDKDFIELSKKLKRYKTEKNNDFISLKKDSDKNISEVIAEKEINERRRKEEKKLVFDVENDIFLREAFNISADYIKIVKSK